MHTYIHHTYIHTCMHTYIHSRHITSTGTAGNGAGIIYLWNSWSPFPYNPRRLKSVLKSLSAPGVIKANVGMYRQNAFSLLIPGAAASGLFGNSTRLQYNGARFRCSDAMAIVLVCVTTSACRFDRRGGQRILCADARQTDRTHGTHWASSSSCRVEVRLGASVMFQSRQGSGLRGDLD